MGARILVLTAGYGEGHNAAARALVSAFDRAGGRDTAIMADPFALAAPRLNAVTRKIYLTLINDAPRVWSSVYAWIDRSNFVQRRLAFFRSEIRIIGELIDRERPDAICCTYPLHAFFLEELARRRGSVPPVFNVVTDSISIHSLWWKAPCTGWFLPNADSADVLLEAGIPATAVHVFGFPVPSFFAQNASALCPPDLAVGAKPRVLHIINSGTRDAFEIAQKLLLETDWEITCAVGRDVRLREKLSRLAAERKSPAEILGWTDQIPRLLMTHHAVVSKAGGATTQEAIAALCPMVVNQIVPGQEEGNFELLRRYRAGALAQTPEAILHTLREAFADNGRLWREWRAALRPLARVDAADDIALHVIAHGRPMPERAAATDSAALNLPRLATVESLTP